jgi:hypothetical protein
MSEIWIRVSPGELLDKLTILRLKAARIAEPQKLANVRRELTLLEQVWGDTQARRADLGAEERELARVNAALWDVEDALREKERRGEFDAEFVALARSVYRHNDERAALKRRVSETLGSSLLEEKSYRGSPPR